MAFSCKRIREGVEESMSIITTMSSYGKDKLILGYKSGYVAVLNLKDSTELVLGEHRAAVNKIVNDSGYVYTSCNNGRICRWEIDQEGSKNEIVLPCGDHPVLDFAVSGKTVIAAPHGDCHLYRYSLDENGVVFESNEKFAHAQSLALPADNLVYIGYKWNIAAVDLEKNEVESLLPAFKAKLMQFNGDDIVSCIGHDNKNKQKWYLIELSRDNMVLSQRLIQKGLVKAGKYNRPICGIQAYRDYWLISTACGIMVYRQNSKEPGKLIVLEEIEGEITSIAVEGDCVYCACKGGAIYIIENIHTRLSVFENEEAVPDEVCLL